MDKLPSPIGPSALIPLLSGCRAQFAKGLAGNASPWALTSVFPRLARELNLVPKMKNIKLGDTVLLLSSIGGFSAPGDPWDLFHTIPRRVLESLVLGTVAFDCSRAQNRLKGLLEDGPGVYVLGLAISGRNGQFLNAIEMNALVHNLELYMHGCEVLLDPLHVITAADRSAIDFVFRVDTAYGDATPGVPRFICDEENQKAAKYLLSSFCARRDAMQTADPTGTVYTIQSPQYVGCGKDVGKRIGAYKLGHQKTALDGANKFFALTVSLLHRQRLKPEVHIVTAIRTWKPGQLSKAEILVAALAGSYVTQDGFNLRDAGGNHDGPDVSPRSWFRHEEYIFGAVDHFAKNVEWSSRDLKKLAELEKHIEVLAAADDGTLEQAKDRCEAGVDSVNAKLEQLAQHADDVEAAQMGQAEMVAALQRQEDMLVAALDLIGELRDVVTIDE